MSSTTMWEIMHSHTHRNILLFSLLFVFTLTAHSKAKHRYEYHDRDHTLKEDLTHYTALFGVSWAAFYLSQPREFREEGSWKNYGDNFGKVVYDNDEPAWNWIAHPFSGSQLFLYFRANGYSQIEAFKMTFIQSAIFEFLVEIYTEPASIQDLYQTPVFGSLGGLILEKSSLYLLNSDKAWQRTIGHVLNPYSLFWFFEGKVILTPDISYRGDRYGINLTAEF